MTALISAGIKCEIVCALTNVITVFLGWGGGGAEHGWGCTSIRKTVVRQSPPLVRPECWRIGGDTRTVGLNDSLKPVPFISFEISPPGRACIQELWDQCGACYVPQRMSIEPMSANGFESIKWTCAFDNKGGDVVVKCKGVTDGYTQYVHFIHPHNIGDGSRIGKVLSPTREMDNHFLWLGVV